MKKKHIFFFAGEQSGDTHGKHLMQAIKRFSKAKMCGVGGPLMRKEGLEAFMKMESFALMGFKDIILSFPKAAWQFRKVRRRIMKTKPDAVVFIDYPGFNIRMAEALRKKGYKGALIHYISPSVWAWGKKRIKRMADTLDLLLTILPFEAKCYENTTLPVAYVGHPTVEELENHIYDTHWYEKLGLKEVQNIISLFPGSREIELAKGLPKQVAALKTLQAKYPDYLIAISCSHDDHRLTIRKELIKQELNAIIVPEAFKYELMRASKASIATSGTITLELALHEVPTVVTYEVNGLNRFVAKYIIRPQVSHFCITNILGDREIYPEYIAKKYQSETLVEEVDSFLTDEKKRENVVRGCQEVKLILGKSTASTNAAKHILELVS